MELLAHLWLPILVSAAAVWVASALAWMALPHHKKDWKALPDEGAFYRSLEALGIPPGNYGFPDCKDAAKRKDPEVKKRWEAGQVGLLSVWGKVSMGKNMVLTFLVYLVIAFFVAYIGQAAVKPGATFGQAFRVLGSVGVVAFSFGHIPNALWFGHYPRAILMCVLDGIVYGLIMGAIFAAMWPKM